MQQRDEIRAKTKLTKKWRTKFDGRRRERFGGRRRDERRVCGEGVKEIERGREGVGNKKGEEGRTELKKT